MGHVISITLSQGTNLLNLLHIPAFKLTKEVGERKFSESVLSQSNKRMRLFYKLLRKNSPILVEDDKIVFGPREAYTIWERKPLKTEIEKGENPDELLSQYKAKNLKQTIDLDMTGKERDGLYWTLFMLCHPGSAFAQGASTQEMLVWPLIAQMGMVGQLEEDICLKKGEICELRNDKEREQEEAEKKVPDQESEGEVKKEIT